MRGDSFSHEDLSFHFTATAATITRKALRINMLISCSNVAAVAAMLVFAQN
jgi:hypothetical protein